MLPHAFMPHGHTPHGHVPHDHTPHSNTPHVSHAHARPHARTHARPHALTHARTPSRTQLESRAQQILSPFREQLYVDIAKQIQEGGSLDDWIAFQTDDNPRTGGGRPNAVR